MGHARDLNCGSLPSVRTGINIAFPSDTFAVRKALQTVLEGLQHMDLDDDTRSVVEIVLAECLNNVVEHAYANGKTGIINLSARCQPDHLTFRVIDDGCPMPEDQLPDGKLHDLNLSQDKLPEGGFGWFLIRELTQELQYIRHESQNHLTFSIPVKHNNVQ